MAETVADLFQPPEQSQEETPQTVSQLFTPEAAMQEARARYRSFTPGEAALATAPSPVPFTGALGGAVQSYQVRRARERIQQGQAEAGDYDSVARADVLAEKTQEAGFPGGLTHLATSAPAMLGEMAAAGGAISGAGRLAAGGAARVLPSLSARAAGASTLGAAGQLANLGARGLAGAAGRTAVVAALPSLGAYERIASGESVGSTVAHTALNAAILGNLGAVVNRLIPGAGIGSAAARVAAGGVIMPVEQQVADAVTTIAGLDKPEHQWGVLGTWTREGPEKAMHQAALQAITGLVFTGSHEIPHAFNRAVSSLRRQGYSDQAAAQVIQQAVNSPPASPRPGPVTDYAEILRRQTEAMRQSTEGRNTPRPLEPSEAIEPSAEGRTVARTPPGEVVPPDQARELQAAQEAQPEPAQEVPPAHTEAPGSPRTAAEPAPAPVQQEVAPKAPGRPLEAAKPAETAEARRTRLQEAFDRNELKPADLYREAGLDAREQAVMRGIAEQRSYEAMAPEHGVKKQRIGQIANEISAKFEELGIPAVQELRRMVQEANRRAQQLHEVEMGRVAGLPDLVAKRHARDAESALERLEKKIIRLRKKAERARLDTDREALEAEANQLAQEYRGRSSAQKEAAAPVGESAVERHAAALGAHRAGPGTVESHAALKSAAAEAALSPKEQRPGYRPVGDIHQGRMPEPPKPPSLAAMAHEEVARAREYRGAEPIRKQASISDEALAQQARERIAADPGYRDRLISELEHSTRPPDRVESMVLLHHLVDVRNERRHAEDVRGKVDVGTPEWRALGEQVREKSARLERIEPLLDRAGSEMGSILRLRRMMMAEDFSLEGLLRTARASKGSELTPEEVKTITEAQKEHAAATEDVNAHEDGTKPAKPGGSKGDVTDLRVRQRRARQAVQKAISLAPKTKVQHVWTGAKETLDLSRSFLTAYDFSAVLRQGGVLAGAHPITAGKSLPGSVADFFSERNYDRAMQQLQDRPTFKRNIEAGLFFGDQTAKPSAQEEAFVRQGTRIGNVLRKYGLLNASERAYNGYLNRLRMDVMDLHAQSLGPHASKEELAAVANWVNVATGRGYTPKSLDAAVGAAAHVLFAPRFLISRAQVLTGQPLYSGSAATRKLIAIDYVKAVASLAAFYGVASVTSAALMNDEAKFSFDPRSADFGKLIIGNTRVDPLAGLSQLAVFMTRMIGGQTKSSTSGRVHELMQNRSLLSRMGFKAEPLRFGQQNWLDVATSFGRSKLAPVPAAGVDVLSQTNFRGQPLKAGEFFTNRLPMVGNDLWQAAADLGYPKAAIPSILGVFGMSLQTYDRTRR